jgi:ribosomal protein S27AE
MVSESKDNLMDGTLPLLEAQRSPFPEPQQVVRRSSHSPCPDCGSITVRSRDRRDMCVICGYLQSHA